MSGDLRQHLLPSAASSPPVLNGRLVLDAEAVPLLHDGALPPTLPRLSHLWDADSLKYIYMGAWSGLLVLQFALTRVLAETLSMPSDADTFDRHLMYETLSHFLLFGFLLGWFINITDHDRFIWLFSWRRWYFFVVYFGTSPVYSYVSDYGCMEHSMEDIANWGPGMWAAVGSFQLADHPECDLHRAPLDAKTEDAVRVAIVGGVAVIFLLVHFYLAMRRQTTAGALVYLIARLFVFGFYVVAAVYLGHSHYCNVHIHHYFTAWCVALFAEFNHPISALMLAISASIFVQGSAAYSCAPLFNNGGCMTTVRPTTEATCLFRGSQNFTLMICPLDGSPPFEEANCYVGDALQPDANLF